MSWSVFLILLRLIFRQNVKILRSWSKWVTASRLYCCERKQRCSLTEDLRMGRWGRRGSGSAWTSEGLCLKRWTDTDTSWPWRTTSLSGWKPCPWNPACLRMWPSTSWTSLLILGSRSESCPGCLTTSSRKWVWSHRKQLDLMLRGGFLFFDPSVRSTKNWKSSWRSPSLWLSIISRRAAQTWSHSSWLTGLCSGPRVCSWYRREQESAELTVLVFYDLLLLNRMVNDLLEEHMADWDIYLPAKVFSLCFKEHSKTKKRPFSALCCAGLEPVQGPRGLDVSRFSRFELCSVHCYWRVWCSVHSTPIPGSRRARLSLNEVNKLNRWDECYSYINCY